MRPAYLDRCAAGLSPASRAAGRVAIHDPAPDGLPRPSAPRNGDTRHAPLDPKIEALIASLQRAMDAQGRTRRALFMLRATWRIAQFHGLPFTTAARSALSVFFRTLVQPC